MLEFFFFSLLCLCFRPPAPARPYQVELISLVETNIVVTRRDKSDVVERRSSRTKVNDVRRRGRACTAISSLRIIELAWTSARARLRQVRGLGIRGSTVVITGRGAPIKKSISPFLGCDPLDKREEEREKHRVAMRKNEKYLWKFSMIFYRVI